MDASKLRRHARAKYFDAWLDRWLAKASASQIDQLLEALEELRHTFNARERDKIKQKVARGARELSAAQIEEFTSTQSYLVQHLAENPHLSASTRREVFTCILKRLDEPGYKVASRNDQQRQLYLRQLKTIMEQGFKPSSRQWEQMQRHMRETHPEMVAIMLSSPDLEQQQLLEFLNFWRDNREQLNMSASQTISKGMVPSLLTHPASGPPVWREAAQIFRAEITRASQAASTLVEVFLYDIPESMDLPQVRDAVAQLGHYRQLTWFLEEAERLTPELVRQLAAQHPQKLTADLLKGDMTTFQELSAPIKSAIMAGMSDKACREKLIRHNSQDAPPRSR